jgi:hypothetical protein
MKKFLTIFSIIFFVTTLLLGYTAYSYKEKSKQRFQVNIPIDIALFQEKLAKKPSDWMINQIHSDLKPMKNRNLKHLLDEFFKAKDYFLISSAL